jgi:hypothetical protein
MFSMQEQLSQKDLQIEMLRESQWHGSGLT